jgi:hypothetical protein
VTNNNSSNITTGTSGGGKHIDSCSVYGLNIPMATIYYALYLLIFAIVIYYFS